MALVTWMLAVISSLLISIYLWTRSRYLYWKHHNVPYLPATPFIGNMLDIVLFRKCPAECFADIYNNKNFENEPIIGIHIFHKPGLLIKNLDLIKRILVKDFNSFSNRYSASDVHTDSLGGYNLFFVKNPIWKQMRSNITPIFTTGKMKQLFHLINDIGNKLNAHLLSLKMNSKTKSVCMDLKETSSQFTTDVIASAAYGVEANSLKNPEGEFRKNGRNIFTFTWARAIEFTTFFFIPELVPFFKFKVFSKESTEFLRSTFNYIMSERENSKQVRNDLIDVLINIKNSSKIKINNIDVKMDGDILVSQAALFFTAGYETTSSTMSFGFYELSKKPGIQQKLRDEIKATLKKCNGELTYEAVFGMEYLHMVVQEILRLYPPLPFLDRECDNIGEKGYSLEPVSEFTIPNKMPVYIPIYAIQRDEKYFPNPEEFNPERFAPENKDNIVPYSYMPFGIGPRACIGERFGMMQAKLGLIHFLKNHYVRPSVKSHEVMKLEKKALIIQSEGGILCDIIRDELTI